jgi:L-ascorbate metabolism protein UlaG (beta-lactamase superfamily)
VPTPEIKPPPRVKAAHLTWIGHGTVLLDLDGVRLLTDPVLRNRVWHLRRQVPGADAPKYADVDAVLVSHLHFDHLDLPSLKRLGRGVPLVVPRGGGSLLVRRGFRRVVEVEAGEEVRIGALTIRATHAEHNGLRLPLGAKAPALGYVIGGSRRIYFAGDTDLFEDLVEIGRDLDVALLPIWGWGPSAGPGHLDPRRAAEALKLLRPLLAVPIHWGTYAPLGLGRVQSTLLSDPVKVFRREAAGIAPEVKVCVLGLGETLWLDSNVDGGFKCLSEPLRFCKDAR